MRKYTIPKIAYVMLIAVLGCLSFGYTYAYFSSVAKAENATVLGKINIVWRTTGDKSSTVAGLFADANNIEISELVTLKRGQYSQLTATDKFGDTINLKLQVANSGEDASVPAYCRIKIEAKYTPNGGTATDCGDDWIQLALNDGEDNTLITEFDQNGWFYDETTKYYYYGEKTGSVSSPKITLREIPAGESRVLAERIYLSNNASAEMLGAEVKIMLKLEGVQSANKAYQSVWNVTW